MVVRVIKAGRAIVTPGAVATLQQIACQGKTQGPCDYVTMDLSCFLTATTVLTSGLNFAVDRVELSIDQMTDPTGGSNSAGVGSTFYTLPGGGFLAAAGNPALMICQGVLSHVNRMLYQLEVQQMGTPLGTVAVYEYGLVARLPLGKSMPCTFTVTVYLVATAGYCAAGWTYLNNITLELYAHLVDSVADLKVKQNRLLGMGPAAEGPLFDIPNSPGYWFLGFCLEIRPTAGNLGVNNLGGGRTVVGATGDGWARVTNSDGVIFDHATGNMLKQDAMVFCPPYRHWATVDLFSNDMYNLGDYYRLMAAPIEAKDLKIQFFPTSGGLATDVYLIWYFYSKSGAQIKQSNAQQAADVSFGAGGSKNSQQVGK